MVSAIRLSGLVSGLDTETIVKDLMKAERAPLDKLFQKKQTEEWRRDKYREMNALMLDLRNSTLDMRLQRTYLVKSVTSDQENIVTAKQKGTPSQAVYDVTVSSLSQPAKAASVKFTNSLPNETTAIGEAFKFKVGTATIDVAATDTINSVIQKVNAVSSTTGVSASYLKDDKSITFTTTASGAAQAISIDVVAPATTFGTTNKLNLSVGSVNSTAETFSTDSGTQLSKDVTPGAISINGISYTVTSSVFNFDGVEFNIKSTGTTRVNVKRDEDAIFNSIKGFVGKYNEIIGKINGVLSEERYSDYKPLLDEEREALSEKQIEQWEARAKSGLLRRDPLLSNTLTDMRLALSTKVTGTGIDPKYDTLSEIGITTGTYSENGKLYIDETKLRQAISQAGDKVMALFTQSSTSTDETTKYNENGIAQRLYGLLGSSMGNITNKAGSAAALVDNSDIGNSLKRINNEMNRWEDRLQQIEDRYWKQFNAMEVAMNKANSQNSWLAQQFAQ